MVEEREQLAKRVFPALRKLCESRGVVWGEVDLRWGITQEQSERGEVLPICLDEIHRCRPYFIGLLGERYGWVPDAIPPQLIEREPWLQEHLKHSVTELEILHGVLNNPDMAEHAFFYFRDPEYLKRLPADAHPDDYFSENPAARAKLVELKDRIRRSRFPTQENYPDPKALGELVLKDMTGVIDRLFPEGTQPDALDREAAEHETFASSRCVVEVRPGEKVGVYIGRREYTDRLDAHAAGDGPPLVVLGESGSGKTALLANWARGYRATHRGEFVIQHFIGATPASADWMAMLRRILGEFNRMFDLHLEIPDQPEALRERFANALSMAAARGRVILVLDGLNQLEDRDQAPDLVWLPPVIPSNIRLILSTLPGRSLDDLKQRGWPSMEVQPLDRNERQKLIVEYLKQYRKELSRPRVERIAAAPQTANPLYLRALLEELRLWGDHETLGKCIDGYLEAGTVEQLYEKILKRYEEDYEDADHRGLVRDAMSLLWAARRGLTEAEILALLGSKNDPLPRIYWSPLYLAAEQSLVSRSGLIGFFHDYFRQAVRKLYLPTEEDCRHAHLRLANYFQRSELSPRQVDELPWQLAQAEAWQRLYTLLADLAFFDAAWQGNQFEVKANWALIEEHSSFRMVDAYRPVLDAPQPEMDSTIWRLSILLDDTGHSEEALSLRSWLVEHFRATGDKTNLGASLGGQALILKARGDLDGAMALHREEERICRELGNRDGLQRTLGNQALILYARGDLDGAMALHKEKERICRELGNKDGLQACLGNQAVILYARGDLDGAMALHKEEERICRELGNKAGLQACLGNQALILKARGDLDKAMALHREEERICRELGNRDGLQRTLGNQALILYARGDLDGAMALHKEKERICRELGNKDGLSYCLGGQALILQARGDLDGAMALHKEEERICRELGNKDGVQRTLGNQALILKARGDLDGAMALHKEKERIFRELGNKAGLSNSLVGQALILQARGDLDGAMALYREVERICRELGNNERLQACLGNQALILKARGDLDGAMALHKEEERICRELGNKDGLQGTLVNQANVLYTRGDLDGAMALFKEAERICRELGNKDGLQACLGNQAVILEARGDLDGAMALHKEQERLCRELGNKAELESALGNQGEILQARGDLDGAMTLYKEQERLCRELGNKAGLQAALGNQGLILKARGDLDGAMTLYKEQERLCRELGNKAGLQAALGNQGLILQARGDLDGAMTLYKEKERLCRELGNKTGLQAALGNQGMIFQSRGNLDGATALYKEQERLCRELGNVDGLARSLASQAVLIAFGKRLPAEALPLAEEAHGIATRHGLTALAARVEPILNAVRRALE
jgi:tetratricopeptide (TPR) repeat protein